MAVDLKSDLAVLEISASPVALRLPRVDEPLAAFETDKPKVPFAPPVTPPNTKPSAEPQEEPVCLSVAEKFVHDAIRDNAVLELEFLDGKRLRGIPIAVGLNSLRLVGDDGLEILAFNHAVRVMRRKAPAPALKSKRMSPGRKVRQARAKPNTGRVRKRS